MCEARRVRGYTQTIFRALMLQSISSQQASRIFPTSQLLYSRRSLLQPRDSFGRVITMSDLHCGHCIWLQPIGKRPRTRRLPLRRCRRIFDLVGETHPALSGFVSLHWFVVVMFSAQLLKDGNDGEGSLKRTVWESTEIVNLERRVLFCSGREASTVDGQARHDQQGN